MTTHSPAMEIAKGCPVVIPLAVPSSDIPSALVALLDELVPRDAGVASAAS